MDGAEHDPVAMMAELARSMKPERRARFLDAACGGNPAMRAAVEARLASALPMPEPPLPEDATIADGMFEPKRPDAGPAPAPEERAEGRDEPAAEADFLDSLALEAVSEPPGEAGEASQIRESDDAAADASAPTILAYCEARKLDAEDRLRLVERLCRAIDEDHRRGRIRGGLAPGEVRIAAGGTPRLLAKAGGEGGADAGDLRYASPEQVLGEPATTATDVYGLGMVLYEVLTGRYPYRQAKEGDAASIARAVSEESPERPSRAAPRSIARHLDDDLDMVVLHALQKEPGHRYGTAGPLADDIDRFLRGRPVTAVPEGRLARLKRLARRHPAAVVLGGLGTLAVLLGLAAALVALARSQRAQGRSETSYRTARQAIEEQFARIEDEPALDVPELRPARFALLGSLLHYYESAAARGEDARDRRGDAQAAEDAARARMRLAQIHRLLGVGDLAAWQYEQALDAYEGLIAARPGHSEFQEDLIRILTDLGGLLIPRRDRHEQARQVLERARSMLEGESAPKLVGKARSRALGEALAAIATLEGAEDRLGPARAAWRRAIEIETALTAAKPPRVDDLAALASAQVGLGRSLAASPETAADGIAAIRKGLEIREDIVKTNPARVDQIEQLAIEQSGLATLLQSAGQVDPAIEAATQAAATFERLDRRFPENTPYQSGLYLVHDLLTRLQNKKGEIAAALGHANRARAVLESLAARNKGERMFAIDLSRSHNFIGRLLRQEGKYPEALAAFQRAVDVLESLKSLDPANSYQLGVNLALCVPLIGVPEGGHTEMLDDDPKLSPADRLRRKLYGERAIAALEKAAEGKGADIEALNKDPDLDAIRGRPAFQAIVKKLEDPRKG
ncbi:Serine/threonine-protein kinase PknB [Aquisphaera giovannonii]|uniref:Serine/threonine-protein kinase PknB n=1 Tax=Aquisphaera giovannonii TaxID=406548 RepID=A0A5B9W3U4_9BACT|nr:protein kinase [Aquisphaera giovannonii]QEH35258.1 Serine/threonine-protein kinase PknB [Aquisphaera giovannonii]